MAYNKSKGKQKHGDVIYDKDTDTQIDFEQNEIKFRTGGSIRGSFANSGLVVTGTIGGFTSVSGSGDITYGGNVSGSGNIHGNSITASNDFQVGRNSHFGHRFSPENHTVIDQNGQISSSAVANHYFRSSLTTDGAVTAVGTMACSSISGSGFHLTNAFSCSRGAFRISSDAKINKFNEISSSTAAASFGQINVQEMFTVSTAGVVYSSASVSAPVLSGSSTSFGGINVGQGMFTVANNGAVVGASLNNSNGGITNAGSIAGATTISGSGALSVGAGATLAGALNLQNGGITNAGSIIGATSVATDRIVSTEADIDFTEGGSATGMYIQIGDPDTRIFKLDATGSMWVYDNIKVGTAANLVAYGTPGDLHASGTVSGSNARFTTANMDTLTVSTLVGGSPLSISASSITFSGSVDFSGSSAISASAATFTALTASAISGGSPLTLYGDTITMVGGAAGSTIVTSAHLSSSLSVSASSIHTQETSSFLSRVGIGTLSPAYDLHVNGAGVTVATIDGGASADAYLKLATNGVEKSYIKLGSGGNLSIVQDASGGDMIFKAKPGGASTEFLRYNSGDRAITASQDLYVVGDITSSHNLTINGSISGSVGVHITGSNPHITIGVPSDGTANSGMLAIRPKDTSNRVLCLMQGAEADGMRLAFGVSGSGQVLVGGNHLVGVFNVSGSDTEHLINAKSDTQNPAFYVSGSGDLYASGKVGIGTNDPEAKLDVNGDSARIRTSSTPASAGALGAAGEIRWDANYIYICVATDTWKRVAISTW